MLKKQALLGGLSAAKAVVGFLAATLIIRTYGIETFGEVAFATTYMMLGTVIEAFLFPKLKADIVNLAIDETTGKHSLVDTLSVCHTINVAMLVAALLLLLMLPVVSYLYPSTVGVTVGITGVALCFLLSGSAFVEQVYVAQDKLVSYRSYDLLTWGIFLGLLVAFNDTMLPLPVLVVLFLGGTAVFRQYLAIALTKRQQLKVNFALAFQFLRETRAASFHFAQANIFGVGTSLLVNAFIKWHMGAKEFGEFSFLQKTLGAPFSLVAQNLGAAWRKYAGLKLAGDTTAILNGFKKTAAVIIAISVVLAPALIYTTSWVAEFAMGSNFSVGVMAIFVLYGLLQLLFAWSSITCSIYEMFKTQRNAYGLLFLGTCLASCLVAFTSQSLVPYMVWLTIVNLLAFIYSTRAIKVQLLAGV